MAVSVGRGVGVAVGVAEAVAVGVGVGAGDGWAEGLAGDAVKSLGGEPELDGVVELALDLGRNIGQLPDDRGDKADLDNAAEAG